MTPQLNSADPEMTVLDDLTIDQIRSLIDGTARSIAQYVDTPLLIMFYPYRDAEIDDDDLDILYRHLRVHGLEPEQALTNLHVILHTLGGNPHTSYRLAQLIRDFADSVTFIIPEYAFSGGTAMTLAGDLVLLAHGAVLSPIDVWLTTPQRPEDEPPYKRVDLVALDHYISMAVDAKVKVEGALKARKLESSTSNVDASLMMAMVGKPEAAMLIGEYYRQRSIAETYARQLLREYMLRNAEPSQLEQLINKLVTEAPCHDFEMDYHICRDIGLVVDETDQALSDSSKRIVQILKYASLADAVCGYKFEDSHERSPFFHYTTLESSTPEDPKEAEHADE